MRSLGWYRVLFSLAALALLCASAPFISENLVPPAGHPGRLATVHAATQSCVDDSGLQLPPGFCATIFADNIGHARHLAVSSSGVLYVNTWSGSYYPPNQPSPEGGFLIALQDKSGAGKADVIQRFGETEQTGGKGGTGVALYNGSVYAELNDRIIRYELPSGAPSASIIPTGPEITVLSGLPLGGDHPMHPFTILDDGTLLVDVATATNACQAKNRQLHSPGVDPCTELETRGGIWRFDAKKTDQKFSPAERYVTGIRNAEGFGVDAAGHHVYFTQHGRDQLHANWPELYKPEEEATLPAEQVMLLKDGGDYGWPECYYDQIQSKLVLAPEYGGDGGHKTGVCSGKLAPVAAFPAHWGPNGMTFYDQKQFPARYRGGLFIAFHGSWDRAPYPQGGYNIVYQPLSGTHASGGCEVFADGFAGAVKSPEKAEHRPSGVAVGPDGSLYVADDVAGRIYKIVYKGGASAQHASQHAAYTPCPALDAPAGEIAESQAKPPEGSNPDAGLAALPAPPGFTHDAIVRGNTLYHSGTCAACHGAEAKGGPLGPDLTAKKWLWSDGSVTGIAKTITDGVTQPKQYRAPMPAMGGAQLTPDQVKDLAAYIWALNHRK